MTEPLEIIDTHNHLFFPRFKDKLEATIKAAQAAGIDRQILIGIDELSCQAALNLAATHPDFKVVLGLHPCDVDQLGVYNADHHQYLGNRAALRPKIYNRSLYFAWLDKLATQHPQTVVGFGETGFDQFHRQSSALLKQQAICFKEHLRLSVKHQKTLVIHSRGARDETLNFLEDHAETFRSIRFVWHCFTEDLEAAEKVTELGGYLGVGGVATYPKSDELREIIKTIPLQHILTETDAPFLPPQQARKAGVKLNEPQYLVEVIELMAALKEMAVEDCAHQLYQNAQRAFNL